MVDIETTGLSAVDDRVIEIAVVIIDAKGNVVYEWCTLVNPGDGHAGPTAIHGIQGGWLAAAPTFAQIAGDLGELLLGRVAVAHNAKFDFGFLEAEFQRIGRPVRSDLIYVDTMGLADQLDLPRRLTNLATELGIAYQPHGAIEDARTTAAILARMLHVVALESLSSETLVKEGTFQPIPPSRQTVQRQTAEALTRPASFLSEIIAYLPGTTAGHSVDSEAASAYLNILEQAMQDGYLSPEEKGQLLATAQAWGLSIDQVRNLHEEFLDSLLASAFANRTLTKAERSEVETAATWLGIDSDHLEVLIRRARARSRAELDENRADAKGRTVTFTGKGIFSNSIREGLCAKYGINFKTTFVKETELLVVGSPDLANATVAKAAAAGTRIVPESTFWEYLGEKG